MKDNNIESMPKNSTVAYVSNASEGWTPKKFLPSGLVLIDATAEVLLRLHLAWWTRYHYHPRKESISHQARKGKSSTQECFGKGYVILPNKVPLNTCRCNWMLAAYQNHGMKMIVYAHLFSNFWHTSTWLGKTLTPPKMNECPPQKGPCQEECSLPTSVFWGLWC